MNLNDRWSRTCFALVCVAFWTSEAAAQVDPQRAESYFAEVAALCTSEGGQMWGLSLCGPIALADGATRTWATNQPAPSTPPPQ